MAEIFTTACPSNCYSTCGIRVEVENGRLRAIEAHPDNLATPEGVCLKGLSYIERVYAKDRILHPLQRTSSGDFERITWDAALDRIASELNSARDRYGPRSVFFYTRQRHQGPVERGVD